jgi:exopolyphosphatase/pppGpp-phosphohydrolase
LPESLRSFLHDSDLNNRLSCVETHLKGLLQFWQVHSPHYTCHGENHCEAVEQNLDELIPYQSKNSLDEYEIFLLLCGVFLHDIGIMCATKNDEEKQVIREAHHERSREYVTNNLKDLFSAPERHVIGEICYAHRDFVRIDDIQEKKIIRHSNLGNKEIRVRFLAALLRLADCCDICHTRTVEGLTSVTKPPEYSKFHHALHKRVS